MALRCPAGPRCPVRHSCAWLMYGWLALATAFWLYLPVLLIPCVCPCTALLHAQHGSCVLLSGLMDLCWHIMHTPSAGMTIKFSLTHTEQAIIT